MSAQYELAELQREVDTWFHGTAQDLTQMHTSLSTHLRQAEAALQKAKSNLNGGRDLAPMTVTAANDTAAAATATATSATAAMASHTAGLSVAAAPFNFAAVSGANSAAISTKATPMRPAAFATADTTPGMASPPVSHALDYDDLISEVEREVASENAAQTTTGALLGLGGGAQIPASAGLNLSAAPFAAPSARPAGTEFTPTSLPAAPITAGSAGAASGETISGPCHVLVEFKRQRVLQFESNSYVAPGEFVVVAGDRGEDIGLVTYAWSVSSAPPEHVGKWSGVGVGQVTRVATPLEVSQLQGVQAELEARARDVAQQKVAEHGLPMRIVDAEYQFDRKKLTFYYQSQHRLDFRNLVRDLYKTFRARIWMELD